MGGAWAVAQEPGARATEESLPRVRFNPPAREESFWSLHSPTESTWYTRVDYFHWNESLGGAEFCHEDGLLTTIGYMRRVGIERFRFEAFGGSVNYKGAADFDDGTSEPLSMTTGYLGARGEYDLMLEPEGWTAVSFFLGVGSRLWVRSLPGGYTDLGSPVMGYNETWWTIYPYIGMETRRNPTSGPEWYGSGRVGFTPFTWQHVSYFDVVLNPQPGLTGQLEAGIRGNHFHAAAYMETMSWSQSPEVSGVLQPASIYFTAGLKAGFSF